MTEIDTSISATLRRRAKELAADFNAQYCGVFTRAADRLDVLEACEVKGDRQVAVEAVAQNRRLRATLTNLFGQIRTGSMMGRRGWQAELLGQIGGALAATEPGKGRRILALQLGDDMTRADLEARIKAFLDQAFAAEGQHGAVEQGAQDGRNGGYPATFCGREINPEEAAQPVGAGLDADQPSRAQEADGRARSEHEG